MYDKILTKKLSAAGNPSGLWIFGLVLGSYACDGLKTVCGQVPDWLVLLIANAFAFGFQLLAETLSTPLPIEIKRQRLMLLAKTHFPDCDVERMLFGGIRIVSPKGCLEIKHFRFKSFVGGPEMQCSMAAMGKDLWDMEHPS